MVYGKIMFNNIKEYTPSWVKTVPYSQVTKPTFTRKAQVVSKFNSDPKVKRFWRFLGQNVQKNPAAWQVLIFCLAFGLSSACYYPWLFVYRMNNKNRSYETAYQREAEHQKKLAAESEE